MGIRGPAPKSRDRKLAEGTFRADRDPGQTLRVAPLKKCPAAPSWLSDIGKKEWRRMAKDLMGANGLGAIDLKSLEGYCASYARAVAAELALEKAKTLVQDGKEGLKPRPEIATARNAWAEMRLFASKLGATPADRTRVKVPAADAERTDQAESFLFGVVGRIKP